MSDRLKGKRKVMAERRMFAKSIIDSDSFIDMPATARLLYFDLAMRGDDDGFVDSPKKILRMTGASQDDMESLIDNGFIIPFPSGNVVIRHWCINNYIQSDRYKPTIYQDEKQQLFMQPNKAYTLDSEDCIQSVSKLDSQVSIGKVRKEKDSEGEVREAETDTRASLPDSDDEGYSETAAEKYYAEYCEEKGYLYDSEYIQRFCTYRHSDKRWREDLRKWIDEDVKSGRIRKDRRRKTSFVNFKQSGTDYDDVAEQIMQEQEKEEREKELRELRERFAAEHNGDNAWFTALDIYVCDDLCLSDAVASITKDELEQEKLLQKMLGMNPDNRNEELRRLSPQLFAEKKET